MIYELVSNTLSAITLGYLSGILTSILAIASFHTISEIPLQVKLPLNTMIVVFTFGIASLYLGAKLGTSELFSRSIASILKGC